MKNIIMKNLIFKLFEKFRNFIYKKWPLYKKKPINEKFLKNKSIDELQLSKQAEHDFLSLNIPIIIWTLWAISFFDNIYRKYWLLFVLFITLVNIWVAIEEIKENIKIYDKVIKRKLKAQRKNEEEYKKDIIKYLKDIEKGLNNKGKQIT